MFNIRKLRDANVLVVDDGTANRRLIELVLSRVGVKVEQAENGQEAVERAMAQPFDVILLDMQMPVKDGYTAARELRELGFQAPIIALTAHAMQGDESKCRAAGCTSYLTKPIDLDRLVDTMAAVIGYDDSDADAPHLLRSVSNLNTTVAGAVTSTRNQDSITSQLPMHDLDFREIVADFVDRCGVRLQQMELLLRQEDFIGLAKLAHWLKGSGGTAGFPDLTSLARELEAAAKGQQAQACGQILGALHEVHGRIVIPELAS